MGCGFDESLKASSWIPELQCILEKKSISGTLSCVVQPMFSSDSVIVEHLGSTYWDAGQV
jgi:hypothetical protein